MCAEWYRVLRLRRYFTMIYQYSAWATDMIPVLGASHFKKAVRGGFALIDFLLRVESPKATLIFTDSCARRVPCTPLRQVPGGLQKLQRSLGAARIGARLGRGADTVTTLEAAAFGFK